MKQIELSLIDPTQFEGPTDYTRRHNGTDVSRAAAEAAEAGPRGEIAAKIWRCVLNSRYGLTCEQVEMALALKHQTVSSTLNALERAGWCNKTKEKRENLSGLLAHVYTANQQPVICATISPRKENKVLLELKDWILKDNEHHGGWMMHPTTARILNKINDMVKP